MRPGVYVQEAPLPRIVNNPGIGLTAGAFIGTALMGPTEPILLTSWSQFVGTFGTFSSDEQKTTLAPAVYQFFSNGGGRCYSCRILSGDASVAHTELLTAEAAPILGIDAISAGYWGNGLSVDIIHPYIPEQTAGTGDFGGDFGTQFEQGGTQLSDGTSSLFDIIVRNTIRGVGVVVERFTQVTMNPNSPRYVERIINNSTVGSQYITVADRNHGQDQDAIPAVGERLALTGGLDGVTAPTVGDYVSAMEKFELIEGNLVFNIPGVWDATGVETKVQERGDSFLVVDAPNISDVIDMLETSFPVTSYAGVYYPWIAIADPDPAAQRGSLRWCPPGGSVVGMIMRTDASRGSYKAPAGVGATLTGAVATSKKLTNAELDNLNSYQVNAIRPVPGSGITVMGARTRDFTTTARYISVRRTLNYVKEKAKTTSVFALFEPNTITLWEQLRVANGAFLSELWQAGGLAGRRLAEAFYVKVDGDNNPPAAIANGELHIEIGIAPVFPAEFIIIRLGQFESDTSFVVTEG